MTESPRIVERISDFITGQHEPALEWLRWLQRTITETVATPGATCWLVEGPLWPPVVLAAGSSVSETVRLFGHILAGPDWREVLPGLEEAVERELARRRVRNERPPLPPV